LLGNLNVLLNTSLASYVIEGLLGKELTLSYRTIIWDMVIDGFFNSPFIGNGIRDTVNLFYISERYTTGYMSAHNQILQSLYECGILFFISLVPVVYNVSNKCQYAVPFVGNIFKATYCAILVMFMGEAPGMDKLLSMFIIGIGVSLKCDQYALESFRSGINIKR
ncbi:O-antigen ligase family protein, partial [Parabacteroides distasonis]